MSGAIACIGGGGFLVEDASRLQEAWLLSLVRPARSARPRVVFLGLANGDRELGQLKAFKAFSALGCDIRPLPFFPYEMRRDYAREVRDADLVYVGGGNTVAMLAVWRAFDFERVLHEAWQGGTVMAGVSAGANCWFEQFVTDSVPGGGIRAGLGWLRGTFCPHLDSEAWRQPVLAGAPVTPAWGAPEGVVLHFQDGALVEAVTDKPGATAQRRDAEGAAPRSLPTRCLFPDASSV